MYPAAFEYQRASSIDEALKLLGTNDGAKLIAGGHSLIPMMKLRLAQPPVVVDIGRIAELRGISEKGGTLRIGALTTHAEIAASDVVKKHCPFLAEAAGHIGDPQVRNRGTIGGNLAHADPGSDLPAVIRAASGTIHTKSAKGERQIAAADFFLDLLATDLEADEILTAVEIPALAAGSGSAYLKFEHPASGYAVVGAAAWVQVKGGKCAAAGLAFNGVTATPLLAEKTVEALVGTSLGDGDIGDAVDAVTADDPMGDVFASGEYRLHLAKVYGRRALQAARDRAKG
jgi:carbon-monoxide dehydrogenase medium subunit